MKSYRTNKKQLFQRQKKFQQTFSFEILLAVKAVDLQRSQ